MVSEPALKQLFDVPITHLFKTRRFGIDHINE